MQSDFLALAVQSEVELYSSSIEEPHSVKWVECNQTRHLQQLNLLFSPSRASTSLSVALVSIMLVRKPMSQTIQIMCARIRR